MFYFPPHDLMKGQSWPRDDISIRGVSPSLDAGHQSRHHKMRIYFQRCRTWTAEVKKKNRPHRCEVVRQMGGGWSRDEGTLMWRLADAGRERRWDGREVKRQPAMCWPSGDPAVWCLILTRTHDPAVFSLFRRMLRLNQTPAAYKWKHICLR